MNRLDTFFTTVHSGLDACLITNPTDKYYLTGYDCGDDGILVMTRDASIYFTDARYTLEASSIDGLEVVEIPRGQGLRYVRDYLSSKQITSLGYVANSISHADYLSIANGALNLIDIQDEISTLRIIKDNEEISSLKRAGAIADKALQTTLKSVRLGISERELAHILHVELISHGSEGLAFDSIVAFGKNTSKPHAHVSDTKLEKGDLITIDFGALVDGYRSDMTRTFFYESADEEMKGVYQCVLNAQRLALNAVREGITSGELDAIARESLRSNGLADYFTHSLGHGVGLDIHEAPTIKSGGDVVLREGMVITIEPGVYIAEKGGIRIEDMVLVKKDGYELFSQCKKDLIILK